MKLSTLFARAEEPSIVSVATECCGLHLVRRGTRYQCLCPNPYHHDKHMGSFSINESSKFWGCFACDLGQHQGNISLVSEICGVSKVDAAINIGLTFGLISQDEALELSQTGEPPPKQLPAPSIACKPQIKRKSPKELDLVYRSFIEAAPAMLSSQRQRLMTERCLCERDMEDFFLLPPKSQAFWTKFKTRLAQNGVAGTLNEILVGIPGFMRHRNSGRWSFVGRAGTLCLVARNLNGYIIGFQMRQGSKGCKYISFSAGSVDQEVYEGYCSSGVLIGVERPRSNRCRKVIAITEGKFKALALAKTGATAISIAGVGNWRYAIGSIRDILLEQPDACFCIYYDADLKINPVVARQAKDLALALQKKFNRPVYFADWPLELGKGIDDLYNSGNAKEHLHYYPAGKYLESPFFKGEQ